MTKEEKEKLNTMYPKIDEVPYFMKQIEQLNNVCGLIATLHVLGDYRNGKLEFTQGSVLENYFENTKKLSSMERDKLLQDDEKFTKAHKYFSDSKVI